MRPVYFHNNWLTGGILLFLLGLVCLPRPWTEWVRSDFGDASVSVWRFQGFPDADIRIEVRKQTRTWVLERAGKERTVDFVEIAWAPDGSRTAVLACDSLADDVLAGFDFQSDRLLSAEESRDLIAHSLKLRYGDDRRVAGDPLQWACSAPPSARFLRQALPERVLTIPPL